MNDQMLWARAGRRDAKFWHWVVETPTRSNCYHWTACGKPLRPVEPCILCFPDPILDGPECPVCKRRLRKAEVPA